MHPCMQHKRALTVPNGSRATNAVHVHANETDSHPPLSCFMAFFKKKKKKEIMTRPSVASCDLGFAEAGQVPREVPEQTPECAARGG